MQRVDAGQFRHAPSAGQGADVVHPPQDQLAVYGIGVVEGPCSRIAKLLSTGGKICSLDAALFKKNKTKVMVKFTMSTYLSPLFSISGPNLGPTHN